MEKNSQPFENIKKISSIQKKIANVKEKPSAIKRKKI